MINSSLSKVVEIVNSNKGKPISAMNLVSKNPELAALISKFVTPRNTQQRFNTENKDAYYSLDQSRLNEISHSISERSHDSDNMRQLFPDLELAIQILISSILSPKDMVNAEIIYRFQDNCIPSDLGLRIINTISENCDSHYKLKQQLPDILRESLFDSGAYIKVIVPESSVDEIINGRTLISTEHLSELFTESKDVKSLGILGHSKSNKETTIRNGLESFDRSPYQYYDVQKQTIVDNKAYLPEITDNFLILKLPKLIKSNTQAKIKNILKSPVFSLEANNKKLSNEEVHAILYKNASSKTNPFVSVKSEKNSKRRSVSRPLDLKIPTEATIPVTVPGDPKNHIGYFILIDEEGNPVTKQSMLNGISNLQSQLNNQNSSMSSFLLQKARNNLESQENRNLTIDRAAKIYSDIVEQELVERLKNGIYGNSVSIMYNQDVSRIMLARHFANQSTRLVYVPAEITTYFAFKYFDNGVGKSLLDDLKIITSLRSILLFAKVMAMTKNSIAVTRVNLTLDPNDPDPQKAVEESIHEVIRMRQQYLPLGINSMTDLVDWVQRAGFEFTFENHPGIPSTKFDFETKNMQHTVPESDLDELLRKQTLMALGLSPETVDSGFNSEFATTVVSNNILLSKRVIQYQDIFTPQITKYIKTIVSNDVIIKQQIKEIIKSGIGSLESYISDEEKELLNSDEESFIEHFLDTIIDKLEIGLPKPDITTLENQSQAFDHYSESLDKALSAWISTEFINESVAGELSNNVDMIKSAFKAYFQRAWMAQNGFMPELGDIVATSEDGKPSINMQEMMESHLSGLMLSSLSFIKKMSPVKSAADKDLEALNAATDDTSSTELSEGEDNMAGSENDLDALGGVEGEPNSDTGETTDNDDNDLNSLGL